ncbi:interleukin-1 receptor accessory protein isoform X1 [Cuculus canorus]|uniref:interleukin-1 receptor accessory protein isoform X1 n=2 Tax=Cuculus canorus TaxID=55661 RepID=UPI0023AB3EA6|nr:interleukin-1 receptor accessory protein isoform X1 [Cuculus canorus]XP_053930245.1 interleukin-1 receptor accessory protein isoform X1 [Cuculus canorus]XP_053930246.1 interleukin-1 receptor accessory protein isoform X1 [Cuculus canorus]XP_053930247.1 interleukin-1 receptor accessory protein isoform X1 [Cuculus canorus]
MKMVGALLVTLWLCMVTLGSSSERCDDWGVDTMKQIQIYDGEPAKIKCPLFETFLKYNYSTAHSAGLTLIWYRIGQDRDLEEPINFRLPDNHISKEKDTLWFWPALLNDTGNYTCMLRNTTYCSKVAFPLEVVAKDHQSCVSHSIKPTEEMFYLEHFNEKIICPAIDGFYPASVTPTVKWYFNCDLVDGFNERYPQGPRLVIGIVRSVYEGNYTCIVTFKDHGRTYNLTRTIKMKVVGSPNKALPPQFVSPNEKVVYEMEAGDDLVLSCEVFFTFLKDSRTEVWWTIDGKNTDDIMDPKIKVTQSEITRDFEDKTVIRILTIAKATPEDLKRNYTCYARNTKGEDHSQAIVRLKAVAPKYTVELACGLGATILLIVVLIVVYHVYWLEMVLFYRAHFGTDETILDGKEYDVYVSYARNAEEEEFVLLTLQGVLENEFGYKLCIFDRDSLPGGNTTEAVFDFIQRSRRMIVVLSPDYLTEKSISLLEFKLGIMCQNAIATKLIVVEYRPLQCTHPSILQLKESVSFVTWKGEKSKRSGSQFWKALRLALPLRSLSASAGWNESCSSQSDISLDAVQRRRSRLKGQPDTQGATAGTLASRGMASAPESKAKHRAKHFLTCQCCGTYCNSGSRIKHKHQAVSEPKWDTRLCKPGPGRPAAQGVQGRSRPEPPTAQAPALALCHYSDLSNNDFYVL